MELSKQRLEAFSDGVIAIIITIMVLSIPLPDDFDSNSVMKLMYSFFVYFISFIVVGSFWVQHHRIFSYIDKVTGKILTLNLLYLFFLSLIPILTKWVMQNPGEIIPAIGYDIAYLVVNITYVFIFHHVVHCSKHEMMKRFKSEHIKENRWKSKSNPTMKFSLIRFSSPIIVLGSIIVSFYWPGVSTIFLLGVPVVVSVISLLFDEQKRK